MPFAIPPGMEKCGDNIDWYSDTALQSTTMLEALYYTRPRAKNGFAMLTLSEDSLIEDVYEIGNVHAVWSSEILEPSL
jgi:hypothetical protein